MDITVLDKDFNDVGVLDTYKSFLWVDRYYKYGEFEIYTIISQSILDLIKQDYYIIRRSTNRAMIVEKIKIETTAEGNYITISGRSLESILDRRIVWETITLKGNLQEQIKILLEKCIIKPDDFTRKISNFVFKESNDPAITSLTIEAQYSYTNLYDTIQTICEDKHIGFKITLNAENQFVFELYSGIDRSYDQNVLPPVIFSSKMDNLINSNYIESRIAYRNAMLISDNGTDDNRIFTEIYLEGEAFGLSRREMFTKITDVSKKADDGTILSEDEYKKLLAQKGSEVLLKNNEITSFEGSIDTNIMYEYGMDYSEGDIVHIENEYGFESRVRILEIVISDSEEGFSVYPTFENVEDEKNEFYSYPSIKNVEEKGDV